MSQGTNVLAGNKSGKIINLVENILKGNWKEGRIPEYWDGQSAERIVNFINTIKL
jgi:UDP-N-acetylglucosamine 2-epimerase (non-hydrolysing)